MSDKSKDTGTGGINIDGRVYTPDVGVPDGKGGDQGAYSSGDIAVDKTVKDISKPTRETFAKYLSKSTLAKEGSSTHPNVYPVGVGDQTVATDVSLKTTTGQPVPPAASANDSNFSPSFSSTIGSHGALPVMKRGLADGTAADGNTLLPTAAAAAAAGGPYVKSSNGLNDNLKDYTKNILDPNLYSPLDAIPTPDVVIGDGGNVLASNTRDLKYIPEGASLSDDGGTSTNILGPDVAASPDYTLTPTDQASQAAITTADNKYPIDNPANPIVFVKLVDSNGLPLSATAAQDNPFNAVFFAKEIKKVGNLDKVFSKLRTSYTNALIAATAADVSDDLKFNIKRGRTPNSSKNAVDGDELLSGVIDSIEAKPIETYTNKVLDANLHNVYNPKTQTGVVIPEYENTGVPSGIKDLNKTTTFAADSGTSENILGGQRTLTLNTAAATIEAKTANNKYPVDSPVVGTGDSAKLTEVSVKSDADLAASGNTKKFGGLTIGSNFTANSKGNISRKDPNDSSKNLPDGNTLLPTATAPGKPGSPYVKSSGPLSPNIASYTSAVVGPNIYDTFDPATVDVVIGDGIAGEIPSANLRDLYKTTNIATDAGTFDNVVKKTFLEEAALINTKTTAAKNDYPVDAPASLDTFKLVDSATEPLAPTPNTKKYADVKIGVSDSYVDVRANSKGKLTLENKPNGNALLKDFKTNVEPPETNIEPPTFNSKNRNAIDVNDPVGGYVSKVLEKNRFSSGNRFLPTNIDGVEQSRRGVHKITDDTGGFGFTGTDDVLSRTTFYAPQSLKMGVSPATQGADTASLGAPKQYTYRRLTRIGTILQLRAAGEITFLTDESADPRSDLQQLAALAPGLGQSVPGAPLSSYLLDVEKIIDALPEEDGADTNEPYKAELIKFNDTFQGTMNTALEKFAGFSTLGMFVLAVVLVAVVIVFIGVILPLIAGGSLSPDGTDSYNSQRAGSDYFLGSYRGRQAEGGSNLIADLAELIAGQGKGKWATVLFGLKPTYNIPLQTAAIDGSFLFFGLTLGEGDSSAANMPNKFPPGLAYPAASVVVARTVVRSAVQFGEKLVEIVQSFALGGVMSGIMLLLDLIEFFRGSKMIKAVNTFAAIGDKAAAKPDFVRGDFAFKPNANDESNVTESGDIGYRISTIDSISSHHLILADFMTAFNEAKVKGAAAVFPKMQKHVSVAQVKSRLHGLNPATKVQTLAWRGGSAPSLLLMPASKHAIQATDMPDKPGYIVPDTKLPGENTIVQDRGRDLERLDPQEVKAFEEMLNGEHVPFYFQDLRTNEFVTFHAFLTSLTDDYTASYESSDAIGRVEPVKVYKNTSRKVGLSFIVAALDENDFSTMWLKINKLTTLLYPQYTAGKTYDNPGRGVKFQKPFTQAIGAAPMVRLRVGDLIVSNYSRFNLAGIFGLHGKMGTDYKLGGSKTGPDGQPTSEGGEYDPDKDPELVADAQRRAAAANEEKARLDADLGIRYKNDELWFLKNGTVLDVRTPAELEKRTANVKASEAAATKTATDLANAAAKQAPKNANEAAKAKVAAANAADDAARRKASSHYAVGKPTKKTTKGQDGKTTQQNVLTPSDGTWYVYSQHNNTFFKITDVSQVSNGYLIGHIVSDVNELNWPGPYSKEQNTNAAADKALYVKIADVTKSAPNTAKRITEDIDKKMGEWKEKNQKQRDAVVAAAVENSNATRLPAKFMSPENNSIVRSFESTIGRGLAGFIESMSFDWYDRTVWNLDKNQKAPMMCKVNVSFSPVHDISPGLDSFGHNRAAIYPIGNYFTPADRVRTPPGQPAKTNSK